MPFTTGNVLVRVPYTNTLYPSISFYTFSASGSDNRNANGAGNITLVAGGLGNGPTGTLAQILTVKLTLVDPNAVPSIGRMGLVTLLGLMACGGGFFALRSQRATV